MGLAMLALLRVATGDNWAGLMEDLLQGVPGCSAAPDCETNCCANTWMTPVFFVLFVVVAQFILLNVVVVRPPLVTTVLPARLARRCFFEITSRRLLSFGSIRSHPCSSPAKAVLMKNLTESMEADDASRRIYKALNDAATIAKVSLGTVNSR
jgi:hypothetical protein